MNQRSLGISGIWQHPQSTVPGIIAGMVGVSVALGWVDSVNAEKIIGVVSLVVITVIGALYKGPVAPCAPSTIVSAETGADNGMTPPGVK